MLSAINRLLSESIDFLLGNDLRSSAGEKQAESQDKEKSQKWLVLNGVPRELWQTVFPSGLYLKY